MNQARLEELRTCELCYLASPDVRPGLAWYRGAANEAVQTIDRCSDHVACRDRVEKRGERWLLLEGASPPEPIQPIASPKGAST